MHVYNFSSSRDVGGYSTIIQHMNLLHLNVSLQALLTGVDTIFAISDTQGVAASVNTLIIYQSCISYHNPHHPHPVSDFFCQIDDLSTQIIVIKYQYMIFRNKKQK